MQPEVRTYLEDIRSQLYLRDDLEKQLIAELNCHLQQRISELTTQGYTTKEATELAINSFGNAESVSRLLYEACSKGRWTDAFKLSLPHFVAAAVFASSPLFKTEIIILILGIFIFVSLCGWLRDKPDWSYSWLGYSLLPLFAVGFLLIPTITQFVNALFGSASFPDASTMIMIAIYYILAIVILFRVSFHAVKRDWLLAALMLAPLPIIGCWLFHMQQANGIYTDAELNLFNRPVAQALFVLGFTSVLFIRLRQRVLKVGVAITVTAISMMVIGQTLWGDIGFFGLMGLSLFSLLIFIIPAVTNAAIGHGTSIPDNV